MITPPTRAYLLIGYPRTGSSVLAQALAATGVLGIPQEYFWRGLEARHATEMGLPAPTDETYPPYLGAALRFGTTPNGVFGAKLFWAHAQDLVRRVGLMEEFSHLSPLERVWAPFGADLRLVFLRRDCLRAALSLWRAEVTDIWGLRPGDPDSEAPDEADIWAISVAHAEMHAADLGWRSLLAASLLPQLELRYASVVADLPSAIQSVAAFIGIELPADAAGEPPFYRRQADATSETFLQEWWDRTGGCSDCRAPGVELA